jgi:hypothetical protein
MYYYYCIMKGIIEVSFRDSHYMYKSKICQNECEFGWVTQKLDISAYKEVHWR